MNLDTFVQVSSTELSRLTKIDLARWSRYFNKKATLNEKTLERIGNSLDMTPDAVLRGVNIRRNLLTK